MTQCNQFSSDAQHQNSNKNLQRTQHVEVVDVCYLRQAIIGTFYDQKLKLKETKTNILDHSEISFVATNCILLTDRINSIVSISILHTRTKKAMLNLHEEVYKNSVAKLMPRLDKSTLLHLHYYFLIKNVARFTRLFFSNKKKKSQTSSEAILKNEQKIIIMQLSIIISIKALDLFKF